MTQSDIDGIKALLDVHMEQIRQELRDLKLNYVSMHDKVTEISNNTNVAITKITSDLNHLGTRVNSNMEEIKAVKQRVEIGEDVQVEKWNLQDKFNDAQKSINERSNKKTDKKEALLYGAIGTVITLAITYLFYLVLGKIGL